MRITISAIFIIIFILIFSVLIAKVVNTNIVSDELSNLDEDELNWMKNKQILKMTDSPGHLMWFVQITDIHISIFHDPTRLTEFKEFCDRTVKLIKPKVVLASGDLTDGKTVDNIGSKQQIDEWINYKNALTETNVLNHTIWLDMRGNHDNFDVPDVNSDRNYYSKYSVKGQEHPHSYLYQVEHGGEVYSFLAVDACLNPGPRRPFNFVGLLTSQETENIKSLLEVAKSRNSNYTIWFGHYPTSCIASQGGGLRSLIGKDYRSMAYLCGHLHRMGGLVPAMHTIQKAGFLELELGDWKDSRVFRLLAIDHGLLSFVDVTHNDWPIILVTNPKHALHFMPRRENRSVINTSTHIRVLIFSASQIVKKKVRINKEDWIDLVHVKGPLYVAPWKPEMYRIGLQEIEVYVEDNDGRRKTMKQPFALDGTKLSFDFLPRFVLMGNISRIFQLMYGFMLLVCILPLCILRILHKLATIGKINKPNIRYRFIRRWLCRLWTLSTVDRFFYPLIFYTLYLTVGPWSIGEVVIGYVGVIFAWGIFVNGAYLPGSLTYFYGYVQMLLCQLPLTIILANMVDQRFKMRAANREQKKIKYICALVTHHAPFILCVAAQIAFAILFLMAYGPLAFFLGPLRTGSVILSIVLWYLAKNLPEECTREADAIWRKE